MYDTYRLWYLPPLLRQQSLFDLLCPLGSYENYREVLELLKVIDGVIWEQVSGDQHKHGAARSVEYSSGRMGAGGDIVWYDSYTKSPLSAEAAHALRSNPRELPEHQAIGYIFEPHTVPDDFIAADE